MRWLIAALTCLLGGCTTLLYGPTTKLRTVDYPIRAESKTLLVMIHGTGDRPESFEAHRFIQELRARGADVDAVAIQNRLGYFIEDDLPTLIHHDIVLPARRRGVERIIFLGISSGGLGVLQYAQAHPNQVDGMILFAPFLGPGLFTREIEKQGGLLNYWPNAPFENLEFLWLWIADYGRGRANPPIDLMYGADDRFIRSLQLLAHVLPEQSVHVAPGKHEWTAWLKLWRNHLDRDPFHLVPDGADGTSRVVQAEDHSTQPDDRDSGRWRSGDGSS